MLNLSPDSKARPNQKEYETIKDGKKVIVKSTLKYAKQMTRYKKEK